MERPSRLESTMTTHRRWLSRQRMLRTAAAAAVAVVAVVGRRTRGYTVPAVWWSLSGQPQPHTNTGADCRNSSNCWRSKVDDETESRSRSRNPSCTCGGTVDGGGGGDVHDGDGSA